MKLSSVVGLAYIYRLVLHPIRSHSIMIHNKNQTLEPVPHLPT